jgi:hypothetical protein
VWQQRKRRRSVCAHSRAAVAEEEAGSSGVDGDRGDRQSKEHVVGTLRILDKKRNDTGGLLFIGLKLLATVLI